MTKDQRTAPIAGMPNPNIAHFAEAGRKQVEVMMELQKKFFDPQVLSRDWAERAKVEADLATEFAEKLFLAKSMPEVASVYQEWMSRRMELFTEDSRRLVTESQKFMTAMTQLLSGDRKSGGT